MKCSSCGGTKYLRPYSPWHRVPICRPCFMVWYDCGDHTTDRTNPKSVGDLSLKLKANKEYPWDDKTLAEFD